MQTPIYSLREVAAWKEDGKVTLPNVQRSFVWRPSQIENLWDSLLRGYPIGAFVLTPDINNGFSMLDGQQRATSICLGFGKETFRSSQNNMKVFIDLEKPKPDDNRKFIFRVITKSHPWGYQRTDNTKTLTADNIRKAMLLYGVDDHLEAGLHKFYPYDASLPIPFNMFVDAVVKKEGSIQLLNQIKGTPSWKKIIKGWNDKISQIKSEIEKNPDSKKEIPELSGEVEIAARIKEIFIEVQKMLDNETGQKIPALYLNNEKYSKEQYGDNTGEMGDVSTQETADQLDDDENANNEDEIENLFIRLNAGGTPLRGEELNYSILKSKIDKGLQKRIEEACLGLFSPSRFITIAYRLYQQEKKHDNRDALTMKVKPKQFQRTVNEEKSIKDFSGFLQKLFTKKDYEGKTLLQYARSLLEYDEKANPYGLPYLMLHKLSDVSPEIMFMFLYRLKFHGDVFKFKTDVHRQMIGMITLFMWLGRGEKQKDHSKLLYNVWPAAKGLSKNLFWSSSTIQRAQLNKILTAFPSFDSKSDRNRLIKLREINIQTNTQVLSKFDNMTPFGLFAYKMFYNRDLILYAQRKFLSKVFKHKEYHQDDTNLPFDWDHISPNRFVYKQGGIPIIIKEWYSTNGNFRAWPYSLNRMDQDNSPAFKFCPLDSENYNDTDKEHFETSKKSWARFIKNNKHLIQRADELPSKLLEWSFCNKNWANCECTDMKVRSEWRTVYKLILERNLAICKEWYKELKIETLIPDTHMVSFSSLLNKKKWHSKYFFDKTLREAFKDDERVVWLCKPMTAGKSQVYLYITYSKYALNLLEEGNVSFGFFEKNDGVWIRELRVPEIASNDYHLNYDYVEGLFTLTSNDNVSYLELFRSMYKWLETFPKNDEVNELAVQFANALSSKVRNYIANNTS